MKFALVSLILLSIRLLAFADDAKPELSTKKIQIQSFDLGISAKDFGENYEDRNLTKELPYPSTLPDKTIRDQALKESGILAIPKFEKMDDLDRDLMFMKAKKRSVADLKKVYPGVPEAVLKKLKKEVTK